MAPREESPWSYEVLAYLAGVGLGLELGLGGLGLGLVPVLRVVAA